MARFILKALIGVFLFVALIFVMLSITILKTETRIKNEIDYAVMLSVRRTPDAKELFHVIRPYLDILAGSEELHSREVFFMQRILYAPGEGIIREHNWGIVPWLSSDEINAVKVLLYEEYEGARNRNIAFSETGLSVTLYAFPLHSPTGVDAYLAFTFNESVLDYPDREIIKVEPLGDNWYLTTFATIPPNEVINYYYAVGVFVFLALISLGILIWGIKTHRFA